MIQARKAALKVGSMGRGVGKEGSELLPHTHPHPLPSTGYATVKLAHLLITKLQRMPFSPCGGLFSL